MTDTRQQLVARARRQGAAVEQARQRTLELATQRQATILALHEVHAMSFRAIAAELDVSAEVVAKAIRRARAS